MNLMNLFQISIFSIYTKTIYGLGRYEFNWLILIELIHRNKTYLRTKSYSTIYFLLFTEIFK